MKKILTSLALFALSLCCASAQTTTVTATALKMGGYPIPTGTVSFTPVNSFGVPIPFADGTGAQNGVTAFECGITNGAITGLIGEDGTVGAAGTCVVPDSTLTNPQYLIYQVQIFDTSSGQRTSGMHYVLPSVVGVSGSTWALDHYAPPAQTSNVQVASVVIFTTTPSGTCSTTGQIGLDNTHHTLYSCSGGTWQPLGQGAAIAGDLGGTSTTPEVTGLHATSGYINGSYLGSDSSADLLQFTANYATLNINLAGGLNSAVTGGNNEVSGWLSGASLTTGHNNWLNGHLSGQYIDQGFNNVGNGDATLMWCAGPYCQGDTASGTQALQNDVNQASSAFGSGACQFVYQGIADNCFGQNSGYYIQNGSYNIANGLNTLASNPSGSYNIAIGTGTMQGNMTQLQPGCSAYSHCTDLSGVSGTRSTFSGEIGMGQSTLFNDVSGQNDVVIGNFGLYNSTASQDVAAYGDYAGYSATSLYGVAIFGNNSGHLFTTNQKIAGIGSNVFYNTATGNDLVGAGYSAGENANGASAIVIIGSQATFGTGFNGSMVEGSGFQVFQNLGPGSNNDTANGAQALQALVSGSNVTAEGYKALGGVTSSANSTALGSLAGLLTNSQAINTASTNGLYLGANTTASAVGNTNEIVLGAGAQGNGSNTATIGSGITDFFMLGTIHSNASIGPATAPTGSCSTAGEWVFSQDGHASYCPSAGGTWVAKI